MTTTACTEGYNCPVRLILFDVDGTLISVRGAGKRALSKTIEDHFGISGALASVQLDGQTDRSIIRHAVGASAQPETFQLPPGFRSTYTTYLKAEVRSATNYRVLPGIRTLLSRLEADPGYCLGLATGNIREGAYIKLRRGVLHDFFVTGGFGCDSECRSEIIRQAVERAKRTCTLLDQVFLVGDTPADVQHGKRAGAITVAVGTGRYTVDELVAFDPHLAIDSLAGTDEIMEFFEGSR